MPPKQSAKKSAGSKAQPKSRARKSTSGAGKTKAKSAEETVMPTPHPIRRLLAERVRTGKKKEYLVDWLPTWETRDALKDQRGIDLMKDWKDLKDNQNKTFKFDDAEVLRCSNETEDNSPENCKLMREAVVSEFQKYMNRPPEVLAMKLFQDSDWTWGSTKHERNAKEQASQKEESAPNAAEVLRLAYVAMRKSRKHEFEESDIPYGGIKVKFIGQVDKDIDEPRDELKNARNASKVVQFVAPLFNANLYNMDPAEWKTENMHEIAVPLNDAVEKFATHTPYLLKKPWPLMFTRLFRTSDELEEEFKKVEIKVGEDWCDKSRDFFLYTYKQICNWDMRPIDCVERTYLEVRDDMRDYVKYEYDKDGHRIKRGGGQDGDQGGHGDDDVDMNDADE